MFDAFSTISSHKRWRQQAQPAPIVVAIIRRGNQDGPKSGSDFLLIRRNSAPYQNHWAMVGGKWDFGEPLTEAAIREVQEETGLTTRFVALRGVVSERLAADEEGPGEAAHFLILVCQLDVVSGLAQEQREGEVGWFNAAEIEELNVAGKIIPSDYLMLKRFVEADAIPFYEAEMIPDQVAGQSNSQSNLHRFEQI